MSSIYTLEPPTKGKVCLTTTLGDIEVELWPKEAPLACRNFVQLCLEGFYLKTTFHRIIPKFMIQAGDESGTGTGGVSIYGSYFKDEFHSRLRFTHRGLVACANQNEPDTNNSQFFITLDRCEDLDKRYTIFGRVAGDTIFNVVRIAEVPTDSRNRPIETISFTSCEVLWNPFDDIIPRTLQSETPVNIPSRDAPCKAPCCFLFKAAKVEAVPKKKAVKNLTLLSFGEDEEIEEVETVPVKRKIKSAHDALQDEKLVQEDEESRKLREAQEAKIRKERVETIRKTLQGRASETETQASKPSMEQKLKERILSEKTKARMKPAVEEEEEEAMEEEVKEERERMGFDRLYVKRKKPGETAEDTSLMDEAERTRSRLKQRKRLYGDREKETLGKLSQFQKTLKTKKKSIPQQPPADPEPSVNVELPAAWRVGDYLKDVESIDVNDLISHRLQFDHAKKDAMSRDMHVLDDYIVVDSRLEKKTELDESQPSEKWVGRPNV